MTKRKINDTVFGTSTVGTKGQVVIPSALRKELDIKSGDSLFFLGSPVSGGFNVLKAETLEDLQSRLTKLIEERKKS